MQDVLERDEMNPMTITKTTRGMKTWKWITKVCLLNGQSAYKKVFSLKLQSILERIRRGWGYTFLYSRILLSLLDI